MLLWIVGTLGTRNSGRVVASSVQYLPFVNSTRPSHIFTSPHTMQMQMYPSQSAQQQWSVTSRERMALPPITLVSSSSTPRNGEFPTAAAMHHHNAYAHSTPVMMVVPAGHRPMMLSPPGMAMSPAFARSPLASCSPSISKKRIRVIPNATKSITLDLLRPHFDRPLAEVAAMFGICMTLMKKICRKNGVPRWPHRQIRGLRKSIWSIEKALRSCDSEAQRRSYVEHLDKQKEKLEAILRGPDGSGKGMFHELVMSVPCSPMSELVTPKASDSTTEAASPVNTPAVRPELEIPTPRLAPSASLKASPSMRPAFAPSPRMVEAVASQTPTISRLPSIASLLAAHAKATPTHTFQC